MNMLSHDLSTLQIFQGLDNEQSGMICQALETSHFEGGQTILNEGECIQALWIILRGECIVSRSCSPGDTRVLATLKPGDVFGEMSFVRTAPHSASIKAVGEVTVCSYRLEHFQELLGKEPRAAWRVTSNIAAVLAERLRRMDTWVCDLVDRPNAIEHRDEWQSFRSAVYTNWEL